MNINNPFDKKIEIMGRTASLNSVANQSNIVDAAIFVTDTIDLSQASAEALFEERATPDLALAIFDRVVARMASNKDEEKFQ